MWPAPCYGQGHANHAYFLLFLGFVVVGCSHSSVVLAWTLVRMLFWNWTTTSGEWQCRRLQRQNPGRVLYGYLTEAEDNVLCSFWQHLDPSSGQIALLMCACLLAAAIAICILLMFANEWQC